MNTENLILTVYPKERPYIWSIRANWPVPDGLYFDPTSGEMYSVSSEPYVMYVGRIPDKYLKDPQLNLVGT
jgi:hypothetical protein